MFHGFEDYDDSNVLTEEAIKAAALRYKGEIFTGKSHAEALLNLELVYPEHPFEFEDGFITTDGRFVDRKEGLIISKKSGQAESHKLKRGQTDLDSHNIKNL